MASTGEMQARLPADVRVSHGRLFDRYRLIDRLGIGGTAEVWRATDERLGRDVAIKLLHAHLLPDERSRARFLHEARAVAALDHPNAIRIHDVIVDGDHAALVLELVEGTPLTDRLATRGALPSVAAAGIAAQVASALAAAHGAGLVHRDVKPANVIVGDDGRARIVDFGIAHAGDAATATLTAPGSVIGTLRYMAPEQLAGEPATPATDVFGLGSVLYEMLAGAPPFAGPTPAALVLGQQAGPMVIPAADPELAALALRALARDPADRPASAWAMHAELEDWLRPHGVAPGGAAAAVAAALAAPALAAPALAAPALAAPALAAPAIEFRSPSPTPPDTAAATIAVPATASAAAPPRDSTAAARRIPAAVPLVLAAGIALAIAGAALGGFFGSTPAGAAADGAPRVTESAEPTASRRPTPRATVLPAVVETEEPEERGKKPKKPKD